MKRLIDLSFAADTDFRAIGPQGKEFLPYQHAGVEYAAHLILKNKNILFGDPPGLGKTIQTIGVLNYFLEQNEKVLIICPASILFNWKAELEAWFVDYDGKEIRKEEIFVKTSGKMKIPLSARFIIMSYNLVSTLQGFVDVQKFSFRFLVLDEIQFLKNKKSIRTKALFGAKRGIIRKTGTVIALSGTPIPNRVKEIHPILSALSPISISHMNFYNFALRYCDGFMDFFNRLNAEGASNTEELARKMREGFMIRREKSKVLAMLPEKFERLYFLKANLETSKLLSQETPYKLEYLKGGDSAESYEGMSALRKEIGLSKIEPSWERLKERIEEYGKIGIYCHHRQVFDALANRLRGNGVKFCSIRGADSPKSRQQAVFQFQNDPSKKVFLGSLTAAGVGITLTAANYVAILEPSWVPGENEQAIDRFHRIGQTRGVVVEYYVFEDSLDCIILRVNLLKKKDIKKVLLN